MSKVLNYPGTKWSIAPKLTELIPPHHSYVEPYFGSGAVLFCKPPSDIETVNDLDGDVFNLFRCIQQDPERLARLVMTTPYGREIYEKHCTMEEEDYASSFQRAAGFLTRCWQGYGFRAMTEKVGWRNDVHGRENMYALWDWYRLPEQIVSTAERLRKVQIENRPALEVIRRFNYNDVFMYIDPPYLLSTRRGKQYRHEMTDADHEELLKTLLRSRAKIIISGYESDLYNDYLSGWYKERFKSHTITGKQREEVVWRNYEMYRQQSIFDMIGEEEP